MDGNNMVTGTMTLTDNETGKSVDLPVLGGTIGPRVIDIRKLYAQTGHFTYDPGFMATAACRSSITYIDGDEGILLYRGYPIEELADKSDFLEVLISCSMGSCRPQRRSSSSSTTSPITRWCTNS